MAIDRAAVLKNAEKLLRQGKLDLAIAEYLRVVTEQPRDWNTANVLGDLYARAKQPDKAVEQYVRIADSLSEEGFLSKAGALYKKVLKIKPDHEHSLLQGAEVASSQGLLADARSHLHTVAELRLARKDQRGAAQIRIRLGNLDPDDFDARRDGARARMEINDAAGAARDFKEIATALAEKGDTAGAVEALRDAAQLSPDDEEIRQQLLEIYMAAGDFARARECAATPEQFKRLAEAFEGAGQPDHALAALAEAARLDPADGELRAHLAKSYLARGDAQAAAEYLTEETAGDDLTLLLLVAEMRLRGTEVEAGLVLLKRLLDEDADRRDEIARIGWTVAEAAPEAGLQAVELAVEHAIAHEDWASAAAALQEFVTRVPNHVPALMHLVEICVDGGLEATMYSAQAQLADAYIAAGSADEARFIAEDLVAREPWDRANVERFRNALVLAGEEDPDAIIAERLSGESPFSTTDLSLGAEQLPSPGEKAPGAKSAPSPTPPDPAPAPAAARAAAPAAAASQFDLGPNAVDVDGLLAEMEEASAPKPRRATGSAEHVEVDLSLVLDGIDTPAVTRAMAGSVEGALGVMRDEASKKNAVKAAEAEYSRGIELRDQGRADESLAALEKASRTPRLRFRAASAAARICRDQGKTPQAIEWYERAAQAPPSSPEDGHLLLYELAEALESTGEVARALAVSMELLADAGDYRDVRDRVDRLSKVQTRG